MRSCILFFFFFAFHFFLENGEKNCALPLFAAELRHLNIQWHPPSTRHFTKSCPYHRIDVITLFRKVSIGHLQQVRLANRGRLLLQTPGPVPCICSNAETKLSLTCHVYGPFEFRTSSILLFCFPQSAFSSSFFVYCTRTRAACMRFWF